MRAGITFICLKLPGVCKAYDIQSMAGSMRAGITFICLKLPGVCKAYDIQQTGEIG
jgi:hypothetical protein